MFYLEGLSRLNLLQMDDPREDPLDNPSPASRRNGAIARTCLLLFVTTSGAGALYLATCPELTRIVRWLSLVLAVACFYLPARFVWVSLRRKSKTGQWGISLEERLQLATRSSARITPPWSKPGLTALWLFTTALSLVGLAKHMRHPLMPILLLSVCALNLWNLLRLAKRSPRHSASS
jgi:hypothetical protein